MIGILNAIYRKIILVANYISSLFRIIHFNLKSNNVKIDFKSRIERNVQINSSNNSSITIQNCFISQGTYISADNGGEIHITNSFIGRNGSIVSVELIEIKSNCAIAEMVVIRDQNHNHDLTDKPIGKQGLNSGKIIIESNVWIGAKSTILKSSTIGKNSIIGAMCLVNGNVPESSICVGIPYRIIN